MLGESAIILITLALASQLWNGHWQEVYIRALLLSTLAFQFYHLLFATLKVPSGEDIWRWDCLEGRKGGKVAKGDEGFLSENPCYCRADLGHVCTVTSPAGETVSYVDGCPDSSEGDEVCLDAQGEKVPKYLSHSRDCLAGQGRACTLQEPCTPCEPAKLEPFLLAGWTGGRCARCDATNRGDCKFREGIGPYCRLSPDSTAVTPCTRCCSDASTLLSIDGFCH